MVTVCICMCMCMCMCMYIRVCVRVREQLHAQHICDQLEDNPFDLTSYFSKGRFHSTPSVCAPQLSDQLLKEFM